MSKSIIRDKEVISFTVFQKEIDKILPKVEPMFRFIEGMNPVENRLRWHRLQILHLVIIAILNNYGYDFQYTDSQKIKELNNKVQNYVLLSNFREIMKRSKMSNDKELNHIIKNIKNNLQSNL